MTKISCCDCNVDHFGECPNTKTDTEIDIFWNDMWVTIPLGDISTPIKYEYEAHRVADQHPQQERNNYEKTDFCGVLHWLVIWLFAV